MTGRRTVGRLLAAGACAGALWLAGGCSGETSARLLLERGTLRRGQVLTRFELTTQDAAFSRTDDGWQTVLLSFPLPGAVGRPYYFLYMRAKPVSDLQDFSAGGGSQAVFIDASRTEGRANDVSVARSGQLTSKLGNRGYRMSGYFEIQCPDGRRLSGKFDAALRPDPIDQFERAYLQTDVPPQEPAEPAGPPEPPDQPPAPGRSVGLAVR